MHYHRLGLLIISLTVLASPAFGQLDPCLEAHGGLKKWRAFGSVEYDLTAKSDATREHQLFDLQTRSGLITSEKYTLGASGGDVWIKPGLDALGKTPPRFYMWTPFYFFGMPFVFADPGARQESLGKKTFRGQEYDAVKITFGEGTGDSPEDYYVAYVDPASGRLKLVSYVVTAPAVRKGKPMDQLKPHAILFEEWQTADGLLVPKVAHFYNWTGSDITGEALGGFEFSNVHFTTQAPDASKFAKPADAVVAPL